MFRFHNSNGYITNPEDITGEGYWSVIDLIIHSKWKIYEINIQF